MVYNTNLLVQKIKKPHDYFFIIDISDSFIQWGLWHSGQTNMESNPSKYSAGIIKSASHLLQWFIVIISFYRPYNIGLFQYNIFLWRD